jgi:hypothetical protein
MAVPWSIMELKINRPSFTELKGVEVPWQANLFLSLV